MSALSGLIKRQRPDLRHAMGAIRRWLGGQGELFALEKRNNKWVGLITIGAVIHGGLV